MSDNNASRIDNNSRLLNNITSLGINNTNLITNIKNLNNNNTNLIDDAAESEARKVTFITIVIILSVFTVLGKDFKFCKLWIFFASSWKPLRLLIFQGKISVILPD